MQNRKSRWVRAALPVTAALALTLTACGSDDGGDDSASDNATQEETETEEDPFDAAEEEAEDDLDAEEAAEDEDEEGAGNAHEQFEGADPVYEGMSYGDFAGPVTWEGAEFWVTVDKVDIGENADWPEQNEVVEGMKPAFVNMTFVHVGGEDLEFEHPVDDSLLYTADGEQAQPMIVMGMGGENKCAAGTGVQDIALGDESLQCTTSAIAEDAEPGEVHFFADDRELVWTP